VKKPEPNEFERAARDEEDGGLLREFWGFLRANRKWWLLPMIALLLLFGLLVFLTQTGFAPFIYTLF